MLKEFAFSASGKVAYNTLAQTVRQVATLALGLMTTALVTRYLGRAGYGDLSLADNFMLFFTLGVDFGLNAIVAREIACRREETQRYLENLISLRLLLSVFFILVGVGFIGFAPYSLSVKWATAIILLALIPFSLCSTFNVIYQVNFRYDFSTVACVSGQLIVLGLVLLCMRLRLGLLFLVGASLVGEICNAAIGASLLRKFKLRFRIGLDRRLWGVLLASALPLGLMLLFSQINTKADLFLLSLLPLPKSFGLGSQETVGIYSLAYNVFKNIIALPTFFMNAFFPVMVVDRREDPARLIRRFRKALALLFGISVLGATTGFILAPWVVGAIAGAGFQDSTVALRILLMGLPFFFLSSPLQWFLVTTGGEGLLPRVYGLAAGLTVVLNFLLIPRFSYQGSAVVVGIVEGLIFLTLLTLTRSSHGDVVQLKRNGRSVE